MQLLTFPGFRRDSSIHGAKHRQAAQEARGRYEIFDGLIRKMGVLNFRAREPKYEHAERNDYQAERDSFPTDRMGVEVR